MPWRPPYLPPLPPPRPLACLLCHWLQVDVWAVGVLAYELMMQQPPFFHEDTRETEKLIQAAS